MTIIPKHSASPLSLVVTTLALASVGSFWGCYADEVPGEPAPDASAGSGGDETAPSANSAGSDNTGGSSEPPKSVDAGSGGATDTAPPAPSGGGEPVSAGSSSGGGGNHEFGGNPGLAGTPATGGSPAVGGSPTETGGAPAGGTESAGGTAGVAGSGGNEAGGSGGGAGDTESICVDDDGFPVPYDFSYGLASEYAFELSMNCDVGGYLLPLVLADPEQLSQVNEFVADATGWYRARILRCDGEQTELDTDAYGLLPVSQSSELSRADFDASMDLFVSIVSRHDGLPDGVNVHKKNKIKDRIKSFKGRAVHKHTDDLTRSLSEPDCVPALPPEGGG